MNRYRKEVTAVQLTNDSVPELKNFIQKLDGITSISFSYDLKGRLTEVTLQTDRSHAESFTCGDWIVLDSNGKWKSFQDAIFEKTYKKVN